MSGNANSEPAAEATDLGRLEAGGCSDARKEGAGGTGDGGWGWVVVLGTFVIFGVADGVMYSFGVFVEHFVDHFDCSKSAVGALGSLLTAVTFGVGNVHLYSRMLTKPAGHEAKAEADAGKSEAEDEAEATVYEADERPRPRPRPDTLENNTVCMSMKTKILAFRT